MKNSSLARAWPTLLRWIGTLLAVALLVYLLSQQGWGEILAAVQRISWGRLALAFAIMIVSRLSVSGRWYTLLRSSGLKVSFGQAARITFAGLFATNFLPTTIGGDVVRLAGALQLNLDAAVSAASLVVDRLIGMAGMVVALPFGLPSFIQSGGFHQALPRAQPALAAGLSSLPLGKWWKAAWERGLRIVSRLFNALVIWLKQPRALIAALALTWVHMLCLFSVLYLAFTGMGEHLSFPLIGGLYSIVYLVTLLPVSINGYGVQEISMTLIFSTAGGASVASSLTAALLFRTLMMLASLPGVLFVPGMLPGGKWTGGKQPSA